MAITLYKADGFEHGIAGTTYAYDSAATGTPTIVTSNQRSGLRAMNVNPAAATEWFIYNTAFTIVTAAFCIRFTTLPTVTGAVIARIRNTNANLIIDWDNTNQKIRIKAGGGTAATGGPTITTNTYYRVVVEYDCSTLTYAARMTIDNGTEFSSSVATASSLVCIDVGLGATSSSTYDAIYDDVVVSVTDGDYEQIVTWTNWEVLSAIPTSDGTHSVTSGLFDAFTTPTFSNATTTVNTFIGHRPLQAANTAGAVVRQTNIATTEYVEVLFENPANTHPNVGGVQTYAGHVMSSATGTPSAEVRLMLSDSTEVLTTGSISVIQALEDPGITVTGRKRAAIAPSGGWDETKVDGLKARLGFDDIAADVNFIDLMLEVLYFATGAGPTVTPPRPLIVNAAVERANRY